MNAAQAKKIGAVVTSLLLYAEREGLQPITSGINIIEGTGRDDQVVTLYACRPDGTDFNVRVTVTSKGQVLTNALVRQWDASVDAMSPWETQEIAGVTR